MHPFLQSALDEIDAAAGPLTPDGLARPVEGRWSIAEILEHLTLAFTLNRAALEKSLASGELRARRPRLTQRLGRILVIDVGYFPRVEAPEMTRPTAGISPESSLASVRDALIAVDATLTRVGARFGEAVFVANHPYFAGLTVPQWRKFHWRHTRHHMRQVRARATSSGPRSEGRI
jgi:hypothetical protein